MTKYGRMIGCVLSLKCDMCVFISCLCFVIVLKFGDQLSKYLRLLFWNKQHHSWWSLIDALLKVFLSSEYISLPECIMPCLLPSCGRDHLGEIIRLDTDMFIILISIRSFHHLSSSISSSSTSSPSSSAVCVALVAFGPSTCATKVKVNAALWGGWPKGGKFFSQWEKTSFA